MVDVLGDDLRDTLEEFLRQANGQPFCDGCLAIELQVGRLDVQGALDGKAASMDRGHGRCCVCGQTLTVTRTPAARGVRRRTGQPPSAARKESGHVQVAAVNTSKDGYWRWRIINYAGNTIAESRQRFPSIAAAVAQGEKRRAAMNVIDRSEPVNWRRSTSYLRRRPSAPG
jgi:hypothetical protein